MKVGRLCVKWQVLAGVGAAALAVWVLAPGLVGALLPILVLAVCPLSMLLMMRAMQGGSGAAKSGRDGDDNGEAADAPDARLQERVAALERERDELAARAAVASPAPPAIDEGATTGAAGGPRRG